MNQKQVFEKPPNGIRKIVLSTNIALSIHIPSPLYANVCEMSVIDSETSITINDVKYVVDTGKMRQMTFDATKQISVLEEAWVSVAQSEQRKGRAGRVGPGVCYKLFSRAKQANNMLASPVPELLRSSLENVALQIKLLRTLSRNKKWQKSARSQKKGDVGGIKAILSSCIEPPPSELVEASVCSLRAVGALDEKEMLTPLGFHLAKLPVGDVRLGKMLVYGIYCVLGI